MTLRETVPFCFSPAGLSDTLDSTDVFPGAMASASNIIPDPSTANIWTCRPAATSATTFGSFTSPGYVSVFKIIGSLVYGLVASGRNPGFDEPFCFNLANSSFVTVNNVQAGNVPTTQSSSGDWVPATMDLIGVNLVVTHPGFNGAGNGYIGWFYTGTTGQPTWHSGNLTGANGINSTTVTNAGSGYGNGTYYNVPLTGGTGSGATGFFVVTGGIVTTFSVDFPGTGYTSGDNLGVNNANLGGSGSGWVGHVTAVLNGMIQFTTPPAWVCQFNQRAHFGINPSSNQTPSDIFTDTLKLGCSNANQILTFGNNLPLIAARGLGLSNQLGGIIQALLIFQDDENVQQVTGDYAGSTIAINTLNAAVGTFSPRSIVTTPLGLVFLASDGLRLIDFNARIEDPIGNAGMGVVVPFLNAINLSRINAACNGEVLRISLQRGDLSGNPWQEYWFDLVRKVWSGPHTFPSTCIDVYNGQFVMAPQAVTASLFNSSVLSTSSSVFTENSVALSWTYQTSMFPNSRQMARNEATETQFMMTSPIAGNQITVIYQDQNGSPINQATRTLSSAAAVKWDSATWNISLWDGGGTTGLYPFRIDFPSPVVYTRAAVNISGKSVFGTRLGDLNVRTRVLPYIDDFLLQ